MGTEFGADVPRTIRNRLAHETPQQLQHHEDEEKPGLMTKEELKVGRQGAGQAATTLRRPLAALPSSRCLAPVCIQAQLSGKAMAFHVCVLCTQLPRHMPCIAELHRQRVCCRVLNLAARGWCGRAPSTSVHLPLWRKFSNPVSKTGNCQPRAGDTVDYLALALTFPTTSPHWQEQVRELKANQQETAERYNRDHPGAGRAGKGDQVRAKGVGYW